MQTISIPYTFNRDGYYYFTRRVPKDLAHHYSRLRIVECLRTTSARAGQDAGSAGQCQVRGILGLAEGAHAPTQVLQLV